MMAEILDFLIKGGVLMIPIGFCSVLALGIFLERMWALGRGKVVPDGFMEYVERMIGEAKFSEAEALAASNDSSIAAIVRAGLRQRGRRREIIRETFEEAGRHEVAELERHVSALGTIANIAPLLGLLGTVQGMIMAFQRVVAEVADRSTVDPGNLASGIWTALITTAVGLAVAIPAFIAYKYLISRIDRFALEMEEYSLQLVDELESAEPVKQRAPSARTSIRAELGAPQEAAEGAP